MAITIAPITRLFYQGLPAASGTVTVYQSLTSTLVTLYSDASLSTPISNPVTADSNGEVSFYTAANYNLRVLLKESGGATIRDIDPVYPVMINLIGTNITSATTTDIGAAKGDFVTVTGTTTITSLGTAPGGARRTVRFSGALTLTYNASSLILPGAANITTVAGDIASFRALDGTSNWICETYTRASGYPIVYPPRTRGADIASATTTDIGDATGDFIDVTGTTTITGLGTIGAGVERLVRFTGILILTHNATSLILPGAANITTAVGDTAVFRSLGSGNWVCITYTRANGESIVDRKGTDLASAATVNIGASASRFVDITGATTITAFDTVVSGTLRVLRFTGALTLTHNAASLILPGAANIVTTTGDIAIFESLGSGNWVCAAYSKANGKAVAESVTSQNVQKIGSTQTASASSVIDFTSIPNSTYNSFLLILHRIKPTNDNVSLLLRCGVLGVYNSTASNYQSAVKRWTASGEGVSGSGSGGGATAIELTAGETLGNGSNEEFSAVIEIDNLAQTSTVKRFIWRSSYISLSPSPIGNAGSGEFTPSSAVDSLRLLPSASTLASGTASLYGII